MALFKVFKGLRANLPSLSASKDGYCYYTSDDSMFYIDYEIDGVLYRKALNAVNALTLDGATLAHTLNNTFTEVPSSTAVYEEFNKLYDILADFGLNEDIIEGMGSKMNRHNPTGTGYMSLNRAEESDIGDLSIAMGDENIASGDCSVAIGSGNEAKGDFSIAMGWYSIAAGENSIAIGEEAEATGYSAFAGGQASLASGNYSYAKGHSVGGVSYILPVEKYPTFLTEDFLVNRTIAEGIGSHAEGLMTYAKGDHSHTEGKYSIAFGLVSHAEGEQTKATGNYSHAEGYLSEALGNHSHAQGYGTIAEGLNSFSAGLFTRAIGENQTVIGKYNLPDNRQAFIIGGGENELSQKNIFSVNFDGSSYISKSLLIGNGEEIDSENIDIQDYSLYVNGSAYFEGPIASGIHYIPDAGNHLVTKQYVDDIIPRITHTHLIATEGQSDFVFGIKNIADYYLVYFNGLLLVPEIHFTYTLDGISLLDWSAEKGDIVHLIGLLPNNYEKPGTIEIPTE